MFRRQKLPTHISWWHTKKLWRNKLPFIDYISLFVCFGQIPSGGSDAWRLEFFLSEMNLKNLQNVSPFTSKSGMNTNSEESKQNTFAGNIAPHYAMETSIVRSKVSKQIFKRLKRRVKRKATFTLFDWYIIKEMFWILSEFLFIPLA